MNGNVLQVKAYIKDQILFTGKIWEKFATEIVVSVKIGSNTKLFAN